jgi:hypothetical protein
LKDGAVRVVFRKLEKKGFRVNSNECILLSAVDSKNKTQVGPCVTKCWRFFHPKQKIQNHETISHRCRVEDCINPQHVICEATTDHEKRMKCNLKECACTPECIQVKSESEILPIGTEATQKILQTNLRGYHWHIKSTLNKNAKKQLRAERKEIGGGKKRKREQEKETKYDRPRKRGDQAPLRE